MTSQRYQVVIKFDGSARPNPGWAGAGFEVVDLDGNTITSVGKSLGWQTNNVAEYEGFCLSCETALKMGYTRVLVQGDSMLVTHQVPGKWKVKVASLLPYWIRARELVSKFEICDIEFIRRDKNSVADSLAVKYALKSELDARDPHSN